MEEQPPSPHAAAAPRWRPIAAIDRRVLGVLVEKAKTTPDAYPMSLSALRTGANQKNNRYPLMELEIEDIEESLERLRGLGAVTEVQGSSRVARYRHQLYEWLGVDKVELGVMAELLLRGAQTEGELRGRAARMDPIPDLAALRPILASLAGKGLIVSLTPEGRGHMLTHALYEPRELDKVRAETQGAAPLHATADAATAPAHSRPAAPPASEAPAARMPQQMPPPGSESRLSAEVAELRAAVEQLREELARLRREIDDLVAQLH